MDSSDIAFRMAAIGAVRQAFMNGGPTILEPIMAVEVSAPEEYQVREERGRRREGKEKMRKENGRIIVCLLACLFVCVITYLKKGEEGERKKDCSTRVKIFQEEEEKVMKETRTLTSLLLFSHSSV